MQNIYSPNRFGLTLPHNNSSSFDKNSNIIRKINIYAFIQIYDFSSFLADFH